MSEVLLSDEEEQAVQEGIDAQSLLDTPAFLSAIEAVRRECAEAILQSHPSAVQAREEAYNLSRGLSAVTQRLADLAARGEAILAIAETETERSPDESPADDRVDY